MHQEAIIAFAVIGLIAIFCQWLAWWVKLPAIVFLLISGVVIGPVMGWLHPDALFGDLFFPMVSLAVSVILFEGSLTLKFEEIRGLQKVVRNLLTFGVLFTGTSIAVATHYILDFSWSLSVLFGAIMIVTGPTVIVPMIRTVRPNANVTNVLRWEGIVIDPLGGILAVLVFEWILSMQSNSQAAFGHTLYVFAKTLFVGTLTGAVVGYLFGLVLRKHLLPEYLHNVATLTLVFGAFAFANHLSDESGLLTVTVMGLWLANMKNVPVEDILDFKESLSILLISGLFILLAARVDLEHFQTMGIPALWLFVFIQFVARPVKVFLATLHSGLTWQEKTLISWIGPRGIVAAAVSALFALRLQENGFQQAGLLVPLSFSVIIGTVLLQGTTAKLLAQRLGVAEPDDSGFFIIGANPVARTIAKTLEDNGYRTLLTDSNWSYVKQARMAGLETYYGNAVSEHADRNLDLIGMGRALTLTPQDELNVLAGMRYSSEFGKRNVFYLSPDKDKNSRQHKSRKHVNVVSNVLFGHDVTFARLASLIAQGAKTRQTKLSENFDYRDYQKQYGKRAILLFAFDTRKRILFFTADGDLDLEAGWTIVALVQETDEQDQNNLKKRQSDNR